MTTTVRERPILFSAPMVRAILDGRKTQTRRVVKPQPETMYDYPGHPGLVEFLHESTSGTYKRESFARHRCKYGVPGDRLWVREAWRELGSGQRADGKIPKIKVPCIYATDAPDDGPFRPSIHMPRWASRLTLEITAVRVQRLQEISDEDAVAEGMNGKWCEWKGEDLKRCDGYGNLPSQQFLILWDSINGKKHPWASNPWIWVIEFRRV